MKIGAMNNPRKPLLDEIKLFGGYGFDYLDLTLEYPEATPERIKEQAIEIKAALKSYDMGLVGHMPWFLNIIHPYESVRKAIVLESDKIFSMAHKLGIEHITIHPDYMKLKRENKQLVSETIASLKVLVEKVSEHHLTLCLENFEEEYFSVGNLKQIMSEVSGLKMTLDVGHAFMRVKKVDNIVNMINELKESIIHVHMHDNGGFRDEHLPLGVGAIEFPKVVEALKAAGYDKTITLEIHAEDREYLQISKRKLEGMWGQ